MTIFKYLKKTIPPRDEVETPEEQQFYQKLKLMEQKFSVQMKSPLIDGRIRFVQSDEDES